MVRCQCLVTCILCRNGSSLPCRTKALEEQLAAAEAGRAQMEQQLAVARSQLADSRTLMDSTQARFLAAGVGCLVLPLHLPTIQVQPAPASLRLSRTSHPFPCFPSCHLQSSVHSQLAQWKALADEKEGRLAAAAEKVRFVRAWIASAQLSTVGLHAVPWLRQLPISKAQKAHGRVLLTNLTTKQVSQLESELRVAATKHKAVLDELRLQHQQVGRGQRRRSMPQG